MSSNRHRAALLADTLYAVVDGDRETLARILADDVHVWAPEVTAASRDELTTVLDRRDGAFADVELTVLTHDVGGDFACAEWTVTMRHAGPIELADGSVIEATGLPVELHGVAVAEFVDGRIGALRQYWNERSLLQQLGVAASGD